MVDICGVENGSVCEAKGIKSGDRLVSINGKEINDVLDYRFYSSEKTVSLVIERDGESINFEIKKGTYDDLGLCFGTYLMDKKRSCRNKCVFCFIDQNPRGMRESIYFKDDDERLSFLQGSYVTLTNLTDRDIERIIEMKITPINVSVHSMDEKLRVFLTGNRFAGESLKKLYRLAEGGVGLNLQFVLCRGINDGGALEYSLSKIKELPTLRSASVVPAGLTRHRDGLYPLVPYDKKTASDVIDTVEAFHDAMKRETGEGKVFCSDEFYLIAERALHTSDYYEGFEQYDNGVGMLTDTGESFMAALEDIEESEEGTLNLATGYAAYPLMSRLANEFEKKFPKRKINVFRIRNDFFGETVTVSGLITGGDYIAQLKGKVSGNLLISRSSLNHDGDLFLDGVTVKELEAALGVRLVTNGPDGYALCETFASEKAR